MKRDLLVVLADAVLAAAVFFLTRETPAGGPTGRDPYRPASGEEVHVRYVSVGGFGPGAGCEIDVRGPGDCSVRWRSGGGRPAVVRRHPLSDQGYNELLQRLARADFFEVDELPSSSVAADTPKVTLALSIGARSHEVLLDGRRRPSKELGPVLEFFDAIRKAATPEPVAAGD